MPSWFQKKPADAADAADAAATTPKPARPGAAVRVCDLLREETIVVDPAVPHKAALLDLLVERVCKAHSLPDAAALGAKVREREQGISTTLDTGLSLPHARVDNLAQLCAGLAVLPKGLVDPQQPSLSIRATFLFFSPNKPDAFPLHLQVLRSVSTLFQPSVLDELVRARTPADALKLLRSREQ